MKPSPDRAAFPNAAKKIDPPGRAAIPIAAEESRSRRLSHSWTEGETYLLTSVTRERHPYFESASNALLFMQVLRFYRTRFEMQLFAYVLMPDHFHLLVQRGDTMNPSVLIRDLKRGVAFAINSRDRARGRTIWQEGYHDRRIRSERGFYQALEYIANNPLLAGLAESMEDYRWSSFASKPDGPEPDPWL